MDIEYDVEITESAQKDLENIYFYISEHLSEDETAANLISELKEKIFSLENMPGVILWLMIFHCLKWDTDI
jgi:plasmid stabilization system protein ParE